MVHRREIYSRQAPSCEAFSEATFIYSQIIITCQTLCYFNSLVQKIFDAPRRSVVVGPAFSREKEIFQPTSSLDMDRIEECYFADRNDSALAVRPVGCAPPPPG